MKKLLSIFAILLCAYCYALPTGYADLTLGMSVDSAKDALKNNSDFGYRGDRDVSLLPGDNRTLIAADSSRQEYSFLDTTYLQFYDEKLYVITIKLKPSKLDYYTVFATLNDKYGEPSSFSPTGAVWQDDSVIFSLEKPLSLKYIDAKVFNDLQEKSGVTQSEQEKSTQQFLDSL